VVAIRFIIRLRLAKEMEMLVLKMLTVAVAGVLSVLAVRQVMQVMEAQKAKAQVKRPPPQTVTKLRQDPKTGVYFPET
jgi:hypothetical protein